MGIGESRCFSGSDLQPFRNNYCPMIDIAFLNLEYICTFFFFFFNLNDDESLSLGTSVACEVGKNWWSGAQAWTINL